MPLREEQVKLDGDNINWTEIQDDSKHVVMKDAFGPISGVTVFLTLHHIVFT